LVPKAAALIKPLTDALKGGKKGAAAVARMAKLDTAFKAAKGALSHLCWLQHPSSTAQLSLAIDASSTHVGGGLQQRRRRRRRGY
jgi:hypothetical protein